MIIAAVGSDHHFFHENIIRYCGRPFRDLDHMHRMMINDWNEVVSPNDIAILLGDLFCGGSSEQMIEIIQQMNGRKILITGNHDRKGLQWYVDHGFYRAFKHRWTIGKYTFSHRPQDAHYLTENNVMCNLHGHSHKHHYGGPYLNFCVDVIGFKPKKVKLDLEEGDLLFKPGKSEPELSWL